MERVRAPCRKTYFRLTSEEHHRLQAVIKRLKGSNQKVRRAHILLKADADGPNWTDRQIAKTFDCRTKAVENIRRRLAKQGFEVTLKSLPTL